MFGGKKALEEELETLKAQLEQKNAEIEKLQRQKDDAVEEAAVLTAAKVQITKSLAVMEEQMENVTELADRGGTAADGVYSDLISGKNNAETFRANHTLFVNKVKEQNKLINELAESYNRTTEQTETAAKQPEELLVVKAQLFKEREKMLEYGRNMSVLALNAAIEAGRMGQSAGQFVSAAEEVRAYADLYAQSAEQIGTYLEEIEEKTNQLSQQLKTLEADVKSQQTHIKHIQKDSMQNIATYETGQREIKELIKEETVGRADALKQAQQEIVHCKEQMMAQLEQMKGELQA